MKNNGTKAVAENDYNELFDGLYKATEKMDRVVSDVVSKFNLGEDNFENIFKRELGVFMMYLSASDGDISPLEEKAIRKVCGIEMSADEIAEFVKENNVCSADFVGKVPASLELMVAAGKLMEDMDKSLFARGLIETFRLVGEALVDCERNESLESVDSAVDCESQNVERMERNLNAYLDMMQEYTDVALYM